MMIQTRSAASPRISWMSQGQQDPLRDLYESRRQEAQDVFRDYRELQLKWSQARQRIHEVRMKAWSARQALWAKYWESLVKSDD